MPVKAIPEAFLGDLTTRYGALPEVEGLFLMGSSALGEVIWDGSTLLSDIEFGVVVRLVTPALRRSVRSLCREMQEEWGFDLDPALVSRKRLEHGAPKNLSFRPHTPNQLMFDIQRAARWLAYPKMPIVQPKWAADELPVWEAIRLVLNRFGEWTSLIGDPRVSVAGVGDRCRDKFLVAMGDARLIVSGRYAPGYGARQALFTSGADRAPENAWISAAYDARINGTIARLDASQAEVCAAGTVLISQLLGQETNSGLGPKSPDLVAWASADRRRVPVRYQAPIAFLDNSFDTAVTMAAAGGHRSGSNFLAQALMRDLPLFLLVYQKLADLLSDLAGPSARAVPPARVKETHALWTRFCK